MSSEALRARARVDELLNYIIIGFTIHSCNGNTITQLALIFN